MTAADPIVESTRGELIDRLPFVEGVRGVAALIVVLGHCLHTGHLFEDGGDWLDASWPERLTWIAWPGTEMVALFLMVSGFSLFYSEDRRRTRTAGTPLRVFFARRAWRILPTYYVALAFGLAVLAVVPGHLLRGVSALGPEPVTVGGVVAHIFLIHNLHRPWIYQENGPLWSLAYEAQLYLLFPLMYWAAKRYSVLLVAGLALFVDVLERHFLPDLQLFGLLRWFALGVLIAGIYRSSLVRRVPTALLTTSGLAFLAVAYARLGFIGGGIKHDAMWGAAFGLLLLAMTQAPESWRNPLNLKPVRKLGLRSYSLYATHFPTLWIVYGTLAAFGVAAGVRPWLMLLFGVPAALTVAELVHRAVEVPSLARVRATGLPRRASEH